MLEPVPTRENEGRVLEAMLMAAYGGRPFWRDIVRNNARWLRRHFDGNRRAC